MRLPSTGAPPPVAARTRSEGFLSIVSSTGWPSLRERLMPRRISLVAACCASASRSSASVPRGRLVSSLAVRERRLGLDDRLGGVIVAGLQIDASIRLTILIQKGLQRGKERLPLLGLRRVATRLEDRELGVRDQLVDLLRLVDRADPVVASHHDERRTADPRELGPAVVRSILVLDDELPDGKAVARVGARRVGGRGQRLVVEVEGP